MKKEKRIGNLEIMTEKENIYKYDDIKMFYHWNTHMHTHLRKKAKKKKKVKNWGENSTKY